MTIAAASGPDAALALGARSTSAPIGWILFALAMGGFAIGTTEFAAMSLLPYFAASFGIDEPMAAHAISAYALGVVIGAPVLAALGARLPRRTLLIALMATFAAANVLAALAPSYGWMLAFRFASGLPHGAYFGVAALVAASLVPPTQRARAVSRSMIGLTVATIAGVPTATWLGQALGWRASFALVGALGLATVAMLALFAPHDRPAKGAGALRELGALKRGQVWLTLGIGAIGFGGMFAVYTYIASTLTEVTGVSAATVPVVLCLFGVGLTIGNLVSGWLSDRALMPTIAGFLAWTAFTLVLFTFAASSFWAVSLVVFLIGLSGGLGTALQTRLMDVAGDAQTLAAALNHSAFNTANALGPWLGGMAIAAGYGWTSTGWVGAGLALAGIAIWGVSALLDQRIGARQAAIAAA